MSFSDAPIKLIVSFAPTELIVSFIAISIAVALSYVLGYSKGRTTGYEAGKEDGKDEIIRQTTPSDFDESRHPHSIKYIPEVVF